jgi:hypothetical protein
MALFLSFSCLIFSVKDAQIQTLDRAAAAGKIQQETWKKGEGSLFEPTWLSSPFLLFDLPSEERPNSNLDRAAAAGKIQQEKWKKERALFLNPSGSLPPFLLFDLFSEGRPNSNLSIGAAAAGTIQQEKARKREILFLNPKWLSSSPSLV